MRKLVYVFKNLYTWIALALLTAATAFFYIWFSPGFVMTGLVIFLAIGLFYYWSVLSLKSQAVAIRFQEKIGNLPSLIKDCSTKYGSVANSCLNLIRKMYKQFPDENGMGELDILIGNIQQLTLSNVELFRREKDFGTEAQKQKMQQLLERQYESISTTLKTLEQYSGNLTLLDANIQNTGSSAPAELQMINTSLEDAIKEFTHD
jgi:hypothetical protein